MDDDVNHVDGCTGAPCVGHTALQIVAYLIYNNIATIDDRAVARFDTPIADPDE